MNVQNNGSTSADTSCDDVLQDVIRIVGEQMGIGPETIREDHSLENDLGCDSLDRVEIMMEVEDQFDLDIPDESADAISTIADIVEGVVRLLETPSSG